MTVNVWKKCWAAVTEAGELLTVSPDIYVVKHVAMSHEHEHGTPCVCVPVRVVREER